MNVGKVCKVTAIILFIIDFIMAFVLEDALYYLFGDFVAFFVCVGSGFVSCLLIYAIGEIIDQLVCSNNNTEKIYSLLEARTPKRELTEKQTKKIINETSVSHIVSQLANNGVSNGVSNGSSWICKNCQSENKSSDRFCKSCGEYK